MIKASSGAIRASEIIYQRFRLSAPAELSIVAELIDRESGLAEALDALRGMVGLVQLIQAREPDPQSNPRFIEAMRVIAKAERRVETVTMDFIQVGQKKPRIRKEPRD